MVFSDTSTSLGIVQDITFKTNADLVSFPIADRTRSVNNWYMKVTSWIIESDGRWQWDDSNQTDQPTATTDLVEDQRDYRLLTGAPSTSQDWLVVERVEIQNSGGTKTLIFPIDKRDVQGSIDQNYSTSGQPNYYDFDGTQLKLYPACNYAKTDGLKVWFKRAPLLFAATDTTKRPGFASIYHEILSLGAKYDFEVAKRLPNAEQTLRDITQMKRNIQDHYGRRDEAEIDRLRRPYTNWK